MHKKLQLLAGFAVFAVAVAFAAETTGPSVKPKDGYVPDGKTAIKIAVAVWEPIYGEKQIAGEKPYRAQLTDGIWTVEGSAPAGMVFGGVVSTEIAKEDGRILRAIHGE